MHLIRLRTGLGLLCSENPRELGPLKAPVTGAPEQRRVIEFGRCNETTWLKSDESPPDDRIDTMDNPEIPMAALRTIFAPVTLISLRRLTNAKRKVLLMACVVVSSLILLETGICFLLAAAACVFALLVSAFSRWQLAVQTKVEDLVRA